ncbi:polysaccharide pyruvyl transferase [Catenovulum agarivorans DS-2]|uniref:Polysaccharide pyruvyl transferase n=1 Tax=Catenovulum agarivorans DS-2 TaxID=1328313 RepID=W7QE26_9ALTE|nr:polysaccharide pyruvyl transferase family protein [Catenovulum agarivorans]EWH11149.1 polysaccharide pyruvyl transferase [Catenovulum agarivorans DS-2]
MKLPSFLQWRYDLYLSEHIDLYGSLPFYIRQKLNNAKQIENAKVAYIYANKRNVGDYISFLGIKSLVKQPGAELFCSPVWKKHFDKSIAEIKQNNPSCILVIGGGGLLQPVFKPFWDTVLASGLRYVLFGIGINKMAGRPEFDDDYLAQIINQAQLIGVRDTYTEQQIQKVAPRDIHMGICPSVGYVNELYKGNSGQTNTLLHMYHPSDLRLKGVELDDLRVSMKQLADKMGLEYQEHSNMTSDHQGMLLKLSKAKVVVSSRLHGCIMSYSTGVPFVPLYCDEKIKSFVQTHTQVSGVEPQQMNDIELAVSVTCRAISDHIEQQSIIEQQVAHNQLFADQINNLINS